MGGSHNAAGGFVSSHDVLLEIDVFLRGFPSLVENRICILVENVNIKSKKICAALIFFDKPLKKGVLK